MRHFCAKPVIGVAAIGVGVTGHRKIDDNLVKEKIESILKQIRDESENGKALRIVSCLADGADQLVAQTGIALGYQLEVVVPFPRDSEVHKRDRLNGQKSLDAFDELYKQAEYVLELNPNYPESLAWDSEEAVVARNHGYEQAGWRMLDRCDLLLAVWDGKPNNRPGSTAQIVARAEEMQIPVFVVHPTAAAVQSRNL